MANPQSAIRQFEIHSVRFVREPARLCCPASSRRSKGLIKLNTNENPYPPSPRVLAAVPGGGPDGRLRLYPNPTAQVLREKTGEVAWLQAREHHRLATVRMKCWRWRWRAFCGAESRIQNSKFKIQKLSAATVQYFAPRLFACIRCWRTFMAQRKNIVPLKADFGLPSVAEFEARGGAGNFRRGPDVCHDAECAKRARL